MAYSPHFGTAWYTFGTALVHPETSKRINGTRLWYTWYTLWKGCRGVAQENVTWLGPSVSEQAKSGQRIRSHRRLSEPFRTLKCFLWRSLGKNLRLLTPANAY